MRHPFLMNSRVNRRTFLMASGIGASGLATRSALASGEGQKAKAKSTILFFLSGGASQIDMWDMKPNAPSEIRGEFQPVSTSAPGVQLCEHLPLLSEQAHHLAFINSVDGTMPDNSHHGYYYHLTGHALDPRDNALTGATRRQQPDDWPFIGSVVSSRLPQHPYLPNAVTLPWIPEGPPDIRAGQFAGRLGAEHDPLYVLGDLEHPLHFRAPALVLEGGLTAEKLGSRQALLQEVDRSRRQLEEVASSRIWERHQERAFALLTSSRTSNAFNLEQESSELRQRYGETTNGMSLLLARRLVEAGVPFITVFWMPDKKYAEENKCASAGGWDTHGNNFHCLKNHLLPKFDRAFSALIEDLSNRGLLDSTLVYITSEMGRTPRIGDPRSGGFAGAGRDHWTYCMTNVMAGGGIRGGQRYGASDKLGEYPIDRRVTPADIAKTVYHAMGIHDLEAVDSQNRPYNLLSEGAPIEGLFG